MKLLAAAFALLIIASAGVAADLSEYPAPFIIDGMFGGQLIVGASAPSTDALAAAEIAVSLQQKSSNQITAGTDGEFNPAMNAILFGQPCRNLAMANILGTGECDIGLNDGEGLIKLVERDGVSYLIVTGKTADDTRKAARFLAGYESESLDGYEMRIAGTLSAPTAKPLEPLPVKKAESPEPSCITDADCSEDQSCIATKCLGLGCWEGTEAKNHDCVPIAADEEEAAGDAPAENNSAVAPLPQPVPEEPERQSFFKRIISFMLSIFG